ncbi:hypothetical protein Poli38472_006079 [Pythium oligandrum]|uniref:Uncharacterized protein n=1 Tax=Pythium oligandrum TaxID=41045 RepID=A0A8K1FMT6_PYTOL|nr:hypothetical protein Poli38472_006079 [Pythium oligandrum]|eukprot:TMW68611.1 hypothetical protein Poli38472_006079 [Pythium oligandrum]
MGMEGAYGTFPAGLQTRCESIEALELEKDAPPTLHREESEPLPPDASESTFLARLFFLWCDPLMTIAARRRLKSNEIWNMPMEYRSEAAYNEFIPVYKANGSIVRTIMRCYWRQFASSGVLSLASVMFSVSHPILLYEALRRAMSANQDIREIAKTAAIIVSILLAHVASTVFHHNSRRILFLPATKAVCAIHTLMFDRAMDSANSTSSTKSSVLFQEVTKIYNAMTLVHVPWTYVIHLSVNLCVLYQMIGDAFIASIIAAIMAQFVAALLTAWEAKSNGNWLKARAMRIRVVNECIKTIQTIKLNAWESRFLQRIREYRTKEVAANTEHLVVGVLTRSFVSVLPEVIMISTFAMLTLSERELPDFNPARAFGTMAVVHRLHATLTHFVSTMRHFGKASILVGQVEAYLQGCKESLLREKRHRSSMFSPDALIGHPAVMVHMVNAIIAKTTEEPLIVSANLLVRRGELVVIHGKTGSGKSTLLEALVGEALQLNRRGSIDMKGSVAYCSQNPWLQTLTIRENILFGLPYDEDKYLNVLHACSLLRDLEAFPSGDKTVVGPKGLNISGGQQSRIALARACYADADIYLVDSPLASVDAIVQSDIFSRCVLQLLKNKTIILVTHNAEIIASPFVDQVVRVEDHQLVHESKLGSSFMVDPQLSYQPIRSIEEQPTLSGIKRLPKTESTSLATTKLRGSKIESQWKAIAAKGEVPAQLSELESVIRPSTFQEFVSLCGSSWFIVPLFLTGVLARGSLIASDLWLCTWSKEDDAERHSPSDPTTFLNREFNVMIYATLIFAGAGMTFYSSIVAALGCREAANALFTRMIRSVIYAPMSFFYSRPIGEIVNRFNGDFIRVDFKMQELISWHAASISGTLLSSLLLMVIVPEMIIMFPFVLHFIYRKRHRVMIALEMLRHVVASMSPCYNFIDESIEGRRVLQAFGTSQRDRFRRINQRHVDNMMKTLYTKAMFESWGILQFYKIDFLLISVLIVASFRRNLEPVMLGLTLTYIFLLNSQVFSWCWSTMHLGSHILIVDRIFEYAGIASEDDNSKIQMHGQVNPSWPSRGRIVFENACFQYNAVNGVVLKSISLHIRPGEKVGLVGRTGSGKSSVLMALFRIHELVSGRILIDDVDISHVDLYNLRSRLSIIPQSPLYFKGPLRSYLDPFGDFEDFELWTALQKTGLGEVVARMDGKLMAQLHENAENLSQGERQLLCLSRVILKKSKILVLDEATASIDQDSDETVQRVLQVEFAGATMISIAHRLESILQFDRVVVMDGGKIVQSGTVEELMIDSNGPFFDLLEGALLQL